MKREKRFGIIKQLYILIIVVLLVVGVITYFTQHRIATNSVREQLETVASQSALETQHAVAEFPSSSWLLQYWYEHATELDLEYDAEFSENSKTREKEMLLREHQPAFQPRYAGTKEVEALPAEDQKLFAELAYSWLLTHINQIKRSYQIDYLFCVVTDTDEGADPYGTQFFLFSGAEEGAVRGTSYLEAYPIGKVVSTRENKSQQEIMRKAVERAESSAKESESSTGTGQEATFGAFAYAGDYVDYYDLADRFGDKAVLIGLTYNISQIRTAIREYTLYGTLYALLYQFILLQLIMLHLFLFGIRPLKKILYSIRMYTRSKKSEEVAENLKEISDGRYGYAIRNNEIGELSEDIISLANEIDDYTEQIETITAESERINAELSLAANIQSSMLPQEYPAFPDHSEFDVFGSMAPAREVGGDFFDYFMLDEDHLAVMIADVSGKGVPAALFMMASQIVIHNLSMMSTDPAQLLEKANREIIRHNMADMFVTVWLGVLELSTGRLVAANAGHEYPILYDPDRGFRLFRDKHGFVIGGFEEVKYQSYEIRLKPGSKLFVYTDGVPEANDKDGALFGTRRMIDALNEAPEGSPEQILQNVRRAVDAFVGEEEQFDDLTMLCLEYKGPH